MSDLERDEHDSVIDEDAPHGITLVEYARIAAAIAEGDHPSADIVASQGLTEAQWNAASIDWMTRMGNDVQAHGEHATLPLVYSDAFSQAQDTQKALPPTDAESYAALVVAIQSAGGPAQPLAERGLSLADYLRLSRHWGRVMSSDPAQAKLFFDAYRCFLEPQAGG